METIAKACTIAFLLIIAAEIADAMMSPPKSCHIGIVGECICVGDHLLEDQVTAIKMAEMQTSCEWKD